MNNAEIIKGIETTIEGLMTIKKALLVEEGAVAEAPRTEKKAEQKKAQEEPINPPVKETEGSAVAEELDVEQLKAMKYNDFKKLASSLGVKCTGTRDEIMERILALDTTVAEESTQENEPVEEEEVQTKSSNSKPVKKLGKKQVDEEEPTTDEFDKQAEEIAEETGVEDIIEALAEVDIKATKKNAVEKLAYALREGLIELDSDDEEEPEESEESDDTDEDGGEITATSYFPELDPDGYNNPENMTEERMEAVEAKVDEILTAYSEGDLTDEDIASYVEDIATESEIELLGDEYDEEGILKLYIELVKRTIDNDGEEHEQGEPYEVADKDLCCGHELKYVKKTKRYICENCGSEYEA